MLFYVLAVSAIFLVYLLNNHRLSFWSKRGFKQLEPSFLFGDFKPVITLKYSLGEFLSNVYDNEKYKKEKFIGLYMFYRPTLLILDTKLVQDILIRDFSSFHDRPLPCDEKNDPLSAHLFSIPGQKWRDLRAKLSPTFTSSKLKAMFPVFNSVGQVLEDYLKKNLDNKIDVFEFRDLMARFNTNIISSVAFGIDNDCINDPDHIFRKMGAKIFKPSFTSAVRGVVAFLLPNHFHVLKFKNFDSEVEKFIWSVVKETVEYRETNNFSRNDFMQLLIQLKNQGYVSVDKNEKNEAELSEDSENNIENLSMSQLTANVLLFFIAGFETSSSTLSYCLYEIARHPEVQSKLQTEIDKAISDSNGEFTYDNLSNLRYLECCIDETLRKYPISPFLIRQAVNDYHIRDTNLIVPKGSSVMIPVLGIHRDPEIYDNPMKFIPERFLNSPHGNGKAEGIFYMPFGDGPRSCIGMRMGKLITKLGLAIILKNFNVSHTDPELLSKELDFHPGQCTLTPLKLFNFKIKRR